jgi:hypothetical protein
MIDWIYKTYKGNSMRHYWLYHDPAGQVIGAVARYDRPDGHKDIIPYFRKQNGVFVIGGHEAPRPLYGLEVLAESSTDRAVLLVEGEKCAAALQSIGLVGITWQGGAHQPSKTDWKPLSGYKNMYLIADNDDVGRRCMQEIAEILQSFPEPPRCLLVNIPGLTEGGDVADVLQDLIPSWDGFAAIPNNETERANETVKQIIRKYAKLAPQDSSQSRSVGESNGLITTPSKQRNAILPAALAYDEFMRRDVKQRSLLFGSWFLDGSPVLVSGEPGCGKSLFAHTIAVALASGSGAFGWKATRPVVVGILDAELFDETIQRRLSGIVLGMNCEFEPENIRFFSRDICADNEVLFPNLRLPEDRSRVLDSFGPIDVLIADNINTLFPGGDERGTQFWNAIDEFIFDCRGRKIALMLVHHTTKTAPNSPAGSSKNVRVSEVSIVLSKVDPTSTEAHFNIEFSKTRELTTDTERRSARAKTDDETKLTTWHIGPYVPREDGNNEWISNARSMRDEGKSYGNIAGELKKSKSTVYEALSR